MCGFGCLCVFDKLEANQIGNLFTIIRIRTSCEVDFSVVRYANFCR